MKKLILTTFLLLAAIALVDSSANDGKLLLVQIVFRHGDRSPITMYPTDPYQSDKWPRGLGELTTKGIWRSFNLGKFLKKLYVDNIKFLPPMFNKSDVYILSTDYDRTIMTAESVLTGLYPGDIPAARWNPDHPDFPWQPIPVHSVPKKDDYFLRFGNDCPKYEMLKWKTLASNPVLAAFLNDPSNRKVIDEIKKYSGLLTPDVMLYKLYDTLLVERENNLTLPTWVAQKYMQVLQRLTVLDNQLLFWTEEMKRLAGGNLLAKLLKNVNRKLAVEKYGGYQDDGATEMAEKAYLYSAHDSTLLALLSALNYTWHTLPHYNAFLAMELYDSPKGPFIKFLYRNDEEVEPKDPHPIYLPACPGTYDCPLKTVLQYYNSTNHLVVRNYSTECALDAEMEAGEEFEFVVVGLALACAVLSLTLIVMIGLTVRQYFSDKRPDKREWRKEKKEIKLHST